MSRQSGLTRDVRDDLLLTDAAFGRKYKRGKAARLEVLENMENRLEIEPLRRRIAETDEVLRRLSGVLRNDPWSIADSLTAPSTLARARVVFDLTFLRSVNQDVSFVLDPDQMAADLTTLVSDDRAVTILRTLILDIANDDTAQDVADSLGIGRQAVYDRQTRLISRLDGLMTRPEYGTLVSHLRTRACVMRGNRLVATATDPLLATLLLERGEFPSVWDVVAVGLWGVGRTEFESKRTFRLVSGHGDGGPELVLDPS